MKKFLFKSKLAIKSDMNYAEDNYFKNDLFEKKITCLIIHLLV
jgi:hypothetical protein